MLVRYRYVPNLFLGPNFERRTGTRSIREKRVTSHHWRAEVERRLTDLVDGDPGRPLWAPVLQRVILPNGIRHSGRSAHESTTGRRTG